MTDRVCETCARWVPRDFHEDWGDEAGWWCPVVGLRVDYCEGYPPCGKATWRSKVMREGGKE